MKQFFQAAAIGCSLPLIQAGGTFKWNGKQARDEAGHTPAYETDIGHGIQTLAMGPAPTSPPQPIRGRSGVLAERHAGSVCGYIEGLSEYPYACALTASCLFSNYGETWVGGCCPTTSLDCKLATTCLDLTAWLTIPDSDIGVQTYSCTSSDYPYCVTMTYEDQIGYSIMDCADKPQTTSEFILYEPLTATASASASVSSAGASVVGTAIQGGDTSTSPPSSTSGTTTAPASTKTSLPLGAIIGGALGGIAIIALLILGLVLILRRRGPRNTSQSPPGGYQPQQQQPPMDQQQQKWQQQPPPMDLQQQQQWQHQQPPPSFQPTAGAGGLVDNRFSTQKPASPPYDAKTHVTTTQSVYDPTLSSPSPGSPPPQVQQSPNPSHDVLPAGSVFPPPNHGVSPTETGNQSAGSVGAGQQGFKQYQQYDVSAYHEMPVWRADGQLREMP